MGVTKYKPVHTPRLLEQKTEGGGVRASEVAKAASETIAHTRELLNESRQLIARARNRALRVQDASESQRRRA